MSLAESIVFVGLGAVALLALGLIASAFFMFLLVVDRDSWDGMEWPRVIMIALIPPWTILGIWALSNVGHWPWP